MSPKENWSLRASTASPRACSGLDVRGGSDDDPDAGGDARQLQFGRGHHLLGKAEIENLHTSIGGHQNVVWFQIAMHESGAMRRRQAIGDLHRQIQELARALDGRHRRPLDELHDEVVCPDVVELTDVGVIQRCDGLRLFLEALAELLVRHLDGDGAIEPRVAGSVHFAHAAGTNGREDFVRAEASARLQCHGCGCRDCLESLDVRQPVRDLTDLVESIEQHRRRVPLAAQERVAQRRPAGWP